MVSSLLPFRNNGHVPIYTRVPVQEPVVEITSPQPDVQQPVLAEQKVEFQVVGLKPNTIHSFFWNDIDRTVNCLDSLNRTTALTTDSAGVLNFEFYYAGEQDLPAYSHFLENNDNQSRMAGIYTLRVSNADLSSSAVDTIDYIVNVVGLGAPVKQFYATSYGNNLMEFVGIDYSNESLFR